jgi:hypothetical protein
MMRAWGLGAVNFNNQNGVSPCYLPSQRSLTIICVTRPRKILETLQTEFNFKKTNRSGIYHTKLGLDIWLNYPTELTLSEQNYSLLALARGKKLQQFLDLCIKQGLSHYVELILYIGLNTDPEVIWQKIIEVSQMRHVIHNETWPIIDEFFRQMPEAMSKLPTFQDVLTAKLTEGKLEGKLEGIQEDKQNVLLRLLSQKFSAVPQSVIDKIKNTKDINYLDQCLDQLLAAKTIDDII